VRRSAWFLAHGHPTHFPIADGTVQKSESVYAVITGDGLKDIKAAIETAGTPIHIAPDLGALDKELKKRKVL